MTAVWRKFGGICIKVAVLTMFNGLSSTYSLVNVVAEHLKMLLDAGIPTKVLVSEDCPDSDRSGIFADGRLEWVKITNRLDGRPIQWHDYSQPSGEVHESFYAEAEIIAQSLQAALADVDVCIMHDIHYQGWHLVHNVAVRKAQESLPGVRFIAFTHSAPVNRPRPSIPFPAGTQPCPIPFTYIPPSPASPRWRGSITCRRENAG